jgi:uncharacterized protein YecT (DUF1311 family)
MTWNRILIFSTLLVFAPISLLRAEEKLDCANAMTQAVMDQCARTDFEEADKELNVIWMAARDRARKLDKQHDAEMKGAEAALLAAQRGWIAYRDGHCELGGWEAHGGSMEAQLVWDCKAELTQERTKQLKKFVEGSGY